MNIDFFISYTSSDLAWAEWVDFQLRQAGYSTIAQFSNFKPGHNFINEMQTALKTAKQVIGLLSPRYLESPFTAAEWMAAFRDDPLGKRRRLIFVKVEECSLSGLLPSIVNIDLVGLTEKEAKDRLFQGINDQSPLRDSPPPFPTDSRNVATYPPSFPGIWHLPIRRKPFFIGRDDLMDNIRAGFSSGTTQVLQALTGMGGVGKTRIAIEHCYRQMANYDVIWWVDGSADRLIHQGLTRLAKELSTVQEDEILNREELLERVERGLRSLRWLLVFDSVSSIDTISDYLPRGPHGHLIVTSRNPAWSAAGCVIEVRTFERVHSIDFLLASSRSKDRNSAETLCEQLGDLPLALEQAGAYVERTGCGLESYSTKFAQRRMRYTRFEDETERVIAAVWNISIRRLSYEDPYAASIVRFLSAFGPHRIPLPSETLASMGEPFKTGLFLRVVFRLLRLVLRFSENTSEWRRQPLGKTYSIERAMESLRRYALLEVNQQDVSLHPLLRSVIQSTIRPFFRSRLIKQCAEIVSRALSDSYKVDEAAKLWSLHALDLGKRAEEFSVADSAVVSALIRAAELNAATAPERITKAPQVIEQALNISRLLSVKERRLWEVVCLLRLVSACTEADRFPDAAKYLREAINVILSMKAPEPFLIVSALSEYSGLLLLDYQTSYASRFMESAISLERKQNPRSLTLADLLDGYAEILRKAGEYEEAESVATEALSMALDLGGQNHTLVGRCRFTLGVIQSSKGNVPAARRNLEAALSVSQEAMGDESPVLKRVQSEIDSLTHPELRQSTAKLFQTPRTDLESDNMWQNCASDVVGDIFLLCYEEARDIALDNVRKLTVRALLESGLAPRGTTNSQLPELYSLIADASEKPAVLGRVLKPLIIPIYRAIADDSRWEEPTSFLRDEVLNQYSFAFRSEMATHLGKANRKLGRFMERSPSFEDWIRFFERRVSGYYGLIPTCLLDFEKGLLRGHMQGTRRGIHGLALQLDARFYFDRLLEKVQSLS